MTTNLAPVAETVSGAFNAPGQSDSFIPVAGRPFNLFVWGAGVAQLQLERSPDGGATWFPLSSSGVQLYVWGYAGQPLSEGASESEPGMLYRLNCTALTSGPVIYRVSQ